MAYGTAADVAALTRRYTTAGVYDATTNPTKTAVDGWINTCSATLDTLLAEQGFTVPVTNATAVTTLAGIVTEAVADLCHAANSSGRFFTERAVENGISPMRAIRNEMANWISDHAAGLEALGCTKNSSGSGAICAFREADTHGNAVEPIFQRGDYGRTR